IEKKKGKTKKEILIAKEYKDSAILNEQAEKEALILEAEAAMEAAIKRAEGQAKAILKVQEATAEGLKMLKEAEIDDRVISLRSLDTFAKVADGKATKIIIPSEIQDMAGLVTSIKEIGAEEENIIE